MPDYANEMGLARWTDLADPYDSGQLAQNFLLIAKHDHTAGKGVKVPNAGLLDTTGIEAVDTNVIRTGAVTATKIGSGAVTVGKIADDAVSTEKIQNSAVTIDKIANNAVIETKLGTGAVSTTKIAQQAVDTDRLKDLNVTTTKLADSSVTSQKIQNNSIQTEDLSFTLDQLALSTKGAAASVSLASQKIVNLGTPASGDDNSTAATKGYVDVAVGNAAAGLSPKAEVKVATTGSETYTISTSGPTSGSVTQINGTQINGESITTGDRILVKDAPAASGTGSANSSVSGNGIYVATVGGGNISLTRSNDMNTAASVKGSTFKIKLGTESGNEWATTSEVTTLNTDPIQFFRKSSQTAYIGGEGITVDGYSIKVDLAASNSGLAIVGSGPTATLSTTKATTSALGTVSILSTGGLSVDNDGVLSVLVPSSKGLKTDATGLYVELDNNAGTNGAQVLNAPGLQFSANGISIKPKTSGGISIDSNGVYLTSNNVTIGATEISLGGSATTITGLTSVTSTTFNGNLSGTTSSLTTSSTVRSGAQDGVIIQGRAGGTNTYAVTITPTTLTGNKTLTLPDTTGTVITTGDAGTITSGMLKSSPSGSEAVDTANIRDLAVTNGKIANAGSGTGITKAKLNSTTSGAYVLPKVVDTLHYADVFGAAGSWQTGDEVYYRPQGDDYAMWHLRYSSALTGWSVISAQELVHDDVSVITLTTTSWVTATSLTENYLSGSYNITFGGFGKLFYSNTSDPTLSFRILDVGSSSTVDAPLIAKGPTSSTTTYVGSMISKTVSIPIMPNAIGSYGEYGTLQLQARAINTGLNNNGGSYVDRLFISVSPTFIEGY